MSYNIILNSTNVNNSNNTQYKYNFINGNFKVNDNAEICIGNIQIPYSWFNISAAYNNNKFNFVSWLGVTYNITLPDGFYSISDINDYMEQFAITNGLYLINSGSNVYYFSIYTNQQYYKNQMVFYPVPTSLPTGYTAPSNFVGFPATQTCPQFVVLNNNFVTYSGFIAGTYGGGSVNINYLSQNVPVGSNINSLLVRCNLIDNGVGFPSDILDVIQINSTFGSNINYEPTFQKWVKMKPGTYNNLILEFVDQNGNPMTILDKNLTISLLLKNK